MRKKEAQHGWSFDERMEHTPGVSLPSLDDFKSFNLLSAYDFEYWRSNKWKYVDERDLGQEDFNAIVAQAITLIDPETFSYNKEAALASALEMAIWSMESGKYQSKIHPNVFQEMLVKMQEAKPKKAASSALELQKLKRAEKLLALSKELNLVEFSKSSSEKLKEEKGMNRKQATELTQRLDKIADQVQGTRPDLAQRIWRVADWLEGDKDESKYMKRFDYTGTYEQDKDEKYMAEYDDMPNQPARHSEVRRRVEGPVKDLNTKPAVKNPHEKANVVDYQWSSALN